MLAMCRDRHANRHPGAVCAPASLPIQHPACILAPTSLPRCCAVLQHAARHQGAADCWLGLAGLHVSCRCWAGRQRLCWVERRRSAVCRDRFTTKHEATLLPSLARWELLAELDHSEQVGWGPGWCSHCSTCCAGGPHLPAQQWAASASAGAGARGCLGAVHHSTTSPDLFMLALFAVWSACRGCPRAARSPCSTTTSGARSTWVSLALPAQLPIAGHWPACVGWEPYSACSAHDLPCSAEDLGH